MRLNKYLKAALIGLALTAGPLVESARADNLRVVRTGTESVLNVPMNRASYQLACAILPAHAWAQDVI